MRRIAATIATVVALAAGAAGCETRSQVDPPTPTPTSSLPTPADVTEHESGPESPISYGLEVPRGATQLGPLVRYRSDRLVEAFRPELDAAEAEREAVDQQRREEAEAEGEPLPSESPTPRTNPSEDTFSLLEDPPKPDVTTSLMRVDGSPTQVLRRMVAQVDAVLDGPALVTDDIGEYCTSKDRRVARCVLEAEGSTEDGRDLRITVTVDPGNLTTRTSGPSAKTNPVMTVTVEYVGDPRSGQLERDGDDVDVPQDVEGDDTSGLIWPKMDEDAPAATEVAGGYVVPSTGTILLSGSRPSFVAVSTERVRQADEIAAAFATRLGEPEKDVVEDLNEISTTYRSTDEDGNVATATYVLSARGNYAMLFYTPAPKAP